MPANFNFLFIGQVHRQLLAAVGDGAHKLPSNNELQDLCHQLNKKKKVRRQYTVVCIAKIKLNKRAYFYVSMYICMYMCVNLISFLLGNFQF